MKKFYLFFLAMSLSGLAFAQTNVYLKINHKLGTAPFQYNTAATNNNNVDFDVSRLQYYVDQITLVHDGGMQTLVPNTWLLVDGGTAVNEMLGSYAITNLESIQFGIGVDSAYNHLDPSTYPSSHPLAPQQPSMHWGWSSGYRFVAMEGMGGANLNNGFEIHALEDYNYHTVSVTTTGTLNGSDLTVELDADYTMALKDIDVSSGLINHGGNAEAASLLENFRDHVFSAATVTTNLEAAVDAQEFPLTLYPNPAHAHRSISFQGEFPKDAAVQVSDLSGKVIAELGKWKSGMEWQIPEAGFYLVSISSQGKTLAVKKLVAID